MQKMNNCDVRNENGTLIINADEKTDIFNDMITGNKNECAVLLR